MRGSPNNPIVFLDIAVASERLGRVVIELFKDKVPKTAENFRALCTGERGIGLSGKPLHYKGSFFHKIVPQVMVQGGDIVNFDGSSGESIYGRHFEDEDLTIPHNDEGIVSMVNGGKPNTNSSQFVITVSPCPQLNKTNVVVGKVLKGLGIVKEFNEIPSTKDIPLEKITIIDCGDLTGKDNWDIEDHDGEDVYAPYPEDGTYNNTGPNKVTFEHAKNMIQRIKNVGNACFVQKKYTTADKKYNKALRYYNWMMKIEDKHNSDNNDIMEIKVAILLNLAAVKLQQAKYKEALKLCNEVLTLNKRNSKALFRRAQAHMGLNEYDRGLADLKRANEENPNNKEILKEIERVKKVIKSYLILEKETCKRMFK